MISIKDLKVTYGETIALDNVNLEIKDKEFLGIIGPNGGGKTTLVKSILGLVKKDKGNIKISDKAVIGYVPQVTKFDRDFPISVEEVILTGHLPNKIKLFKRFKNHEKNHLDDVLNELNIAHLKERQIGELSGGQLQRVLIARALMNHPNILILDEPTAGVDEENKTEIYKMLEKLNDKITILLISHDTNNIMKYIDRVVYINTNIHIHETTNDIDKTKDCPIEWYIKGEKIHRRLLCEKIKGEYNNEKK